MSAHGVLLSSADGLYLEGDSYAASFLKDQRAFYHLAEPNGGSEFFQHCMGAIET